jgi:hypothetical protein
VFILAIDKFIVIYTRGWWKKLKACLRPVRKQKLKASPTVLA